MFYVNHQKLRLQILWIPCGMSERESIIVSSERITHLQVSLWQ